MRLKRGRFRRSAALERAACSAILAVAFCLGIEPADGQTEQPVAYNHKVHAEELSIGCDECHAGVESRERAGFPPDDYCEGCHGAPMVGSPAETRLIELLEANTPLAWVQVTKIADHVRFSHRRHVTLGNIDCAVCHGDMRERTQPITEPAVNFQGRSGMLRCMKCHQESGSPYASVDCVDCHR